MLIAGSMSTDISLDSDSEFLLKVLNHQNKYNFSLMATLIMA